MSKAFKILVDIIIAVCVIALLALVIPPLIGYETRVAGPDIDSNYRQGDVIYGARKPVSSLKSGDEIVYSGDTFSYIYEVKAVNTDAGQIEVANRVSGLEGSINVSKTVVKKLFAIPFIGYILIAMETSTGKLMLIFGALFLVMLFAVAEILDYKRKCAKIAAEDAQADQDEDDDKYFAALTKSMEKPSSLETAYNEAASNTQNVPVVRQEVKEEPIQELILERKEPTEEDIKFAETKIVGLTADTPFNEASAEEIDDMLKELRGENEAEPTEQPVVETEVFEESEEETQAESEVKQATTVIETAVSKQEEKAKAAPAPEKAAEKAKEESVKEADQTTVPEEEYKYIPPVSSIKFNTENMAAVFAEIPDEESAASHDLEESEIPDVSAALVAALSTTQVSRSDRTYQPAVKPVEEVVEPEQIDEIELAIPVRTAEEILDEAYGKGYDPEVIQDDVTGVKLIDFTECLIKED